MSIQIVSKENVEGFDWSFSKEGEQSSPFLGELIKKGPERFGSNLNGEISALVTANCILPMVEKNTQQKQEAYVCSNRSQFIDYAREEILKHPEQYGKSTIRSTKPAFAALRKFVNLFGFDDCLFVNNWLLSTNLMPAIPKGEFSEIHKKLIQKAEGRPLVWKGVVRELDEELFNQFTKLGYRPVAVRQVYLMDPALKKYKKKRPYTMDKKLAEKSTDLYWEEGRELTADSKKIIRDYYEDIYIKKYSALNPAYNEDFITAVSQAEIIRFYLLKREEEILGVQAVMDRNNIITTPFIGHKEELNKELGLYRIMNNFLMQKAIEEEKIFHMSSGASKFKKQRGGQPAIEYNMVHIGASKASRKLPWKLFHYLSEKYVIPGFQKYEV